MATFERGKQGICVEELVNACRWIILVVEYQEYGFALIILIHLLPEATWRHNSPRYLKVAITLRTEDDRLKDAFSRHGCNAFCSTNSASYATVTSHNQSLR
jgi:hypothetical protein